MANVGFIGVGNMGGPMAANLAKAGHAVTAFDLSQQHLQRAAKQHGVSAAANAAAAVGGADVIITMLPAGADVKNVYLDQGRVLDAAAEGALLIDCSTIDVASSREVHQAAAACGRSLLTIDAPVSGGVAGANAASLTFMVGGDDAAFRRAEPLLSDMGKNIVHCGGPGTGQAAKICNNMMLGIQMASVAEAFVLAEHLGLEASKLFDVSSTASGQCWSLTTYCPVPGLADAAASNRSFEPGFATALMLKDMHLALQAADNSGVDVKVAVRAAKLYEAFADDGGESKDFSAIIELVRERSTSGS